MNNAAKYEFDIHPSGDTEKPHGLTLFRDGNPVGGGKFADWEEARQWGDGWLLNHTPMEDAA